MNIVYDVSTFLLILGWIFVIAEHYGVKDKFLKELMYTFAIISFSVAIGMDIAMFLV